MDITALNAVQKYAASRPATEPNAGQGGTGGLGEIHRRRTPACPAGRDQRLAFGQIDAQRLFEKHPLARTKRCQRMGLSGHRRAGQIDQLRPLHRGFGTGRNGHIRRKRQRRLAGPRVRVPDRDHLVSGMAQHMLQHPPSHDAQPDDRRCNPHCPTPFLILSFPKALRPDLVRRQTGRCSA